MNNILTRLPKYLRRFGLVDGLRLGFEIERRQPADRKRRTVATDLRKVLGDGVVGLGYGWFAHGGLSDVSVFSAAEGLSWVDTSGRTFTKPMSELRDWAGERAQAGRQPPAGFPRNNKFGR